MANDHYLLALDREEWNKGIKVSKPILSLVPINDFRSFLDEDYYAKNSITVEILHDPTLKENGTGENEHASVGKKKQEYLEELAALLDIEVADIDPKLTLKQLREKIQAAHNQKQ